MIDAFGLDRNCPPQSNLIFTQTGHIKLHIHCLQVFLIFIQCVPLQVLVQSNLSQGSHSALYEQVVAIVSKTCWPCLIFYNKANLFVKTMLIQRFAALQNENTVAICQD